tara:strand:- start:416 stop:937 length:522 start_codon:yes stop_codon:yes gene_type:complete
MIRAFFYILCSLAIFTITNAFANQSIAYLDINRILNTSKIGKDVVKQLNQENNLIKKKFTDTEKKLKQEEIQIISKKNILSEDEFKKTLDLFNKKISKYNTDKKIRLDELTKKKISSQKKILDIINPIILDYITKESIAVVLKKESLIVAPKELNITDEVIQELDKKIKKLEL